MARGEMARGRRPWPSLGSRRFPPSSSTCLCSRRGVRLVGTSHRICSQVRQVDLLRLLRWSWRGGVHSQGGKLSRDTPRVGSNAGRSPVGRSESRRHGVSGPSSHATEVCGNDEPEQSTGRRSGISASGNAGAGRARQGEEPARWQPLWRRRAGEGRSPVSLCPHALVDERHRPRAQHPDRVRAISQEAGVVTS